MAKFVIENNGAIWGVGDTPEAAWADMERHINATESYAISWGKLPDGTRCIDAEELGFAPW